MRSNGFPKWLSVLMVITAVVVLGPPALVLLLGALGVAIAIGGAMLKVGMVALAIWALVMLARGLFGSPPARVSPPRRVESIDALQCRLDAEERERRAELDRELEAAIRKSKLEGAA